MLILFTIRFGCSSSEISADALIRLNLDEILLMEMATMLLSYKLTHARRTELLSCYILISSAIRKHEELKWE